MNIIEKREMKDVLKYKDIVVLKYKIQYPQIIRSNYRIGRIRFNEYNKKKAMELKNRVINELYKEAKELYEYNIAHGYPIMVFDIVLEYNITYNKGNIISLYFDEYEFTGGAHGSTIRSSQNWNMHIGKQLELSYFYPNNPYYLIDIIKEINSQIKEQIQSGTNQYFDNYCELVLENFKLENYYITTDAIVIFFQQYDIAPYSSGFPVLYLMRNNSKKSY